MGTHCAIMFVHTCLSVSLQCQSQGDVAEQQRGRLRDLEAAMRQAEARTADLREAAASAEARAKETAAELHKANAVIEKLTVS